MTILKIDDNDTLWHYYKKSYTLASSPIEPPTNLCSYFWTSVWGAYCSLCIESPIYMQWLMLLGLIGLDAFLLTGAVMLNSLALVGTGAVMTVMTLMMIVFSTCFTQMRLSKRSQDVLDFIFATIAIVIGSFAVGWIAGAMSVRLGEEVATYGITTTLLYITGNCLLFVASLVAFCLLFSGLILGVSYLYNDTPVGRFLSQIWAVISAWKQQVCPLVEAPESFYVEQGTKE